MGTGSGTNFTTTNNLGLRQPTPGVCGALGVEPAGTSWLELLNSALGIIDQHTHAPGFGALVPSAGIGINADLPFGSFNATGLRSTRFTPIALGSIIAADVGCLVVSGADLYYVDTAANQVRITSGGGVAGTPGSISGLASPAAATYTPASKTFAFTSSSGVVATLSTGPVAIGDASTSNGKACTVQVPNALAANYSMTLLAALPGATSALSISSAGALGTITYPFVAASIANGTLTTTQLSASAGILGTQLAANTVARGQLAAVGQQVSSSSGNYTTTSGSFVNVTNLSVSITTTGRPVMLVMQPVNSASSLANLSVNAGTGNLAFARAGTVISSWYVTNSTIAAATPTFLDTPAAGTYTYTVQAEGNGNTITVANYVLVAYEL